MNRPVLLDLFCGAGGAAMGYHRAGFDVVGVDNRPQPHYPFEFHQDDALSWLHGLKYQRLYGRPSRNSDGLADELKIWAIHASPPCHDYTVLRAVTGLRGDGHLLPDTRNLLQQTGLPWVIENVPGAPIRTDFKLCGCMFGLPGLRRERWFETSWRGFDLRPPCSHQIPAVDVTGHGRGQDSRRRSAVRYTQADRKRAIGIDWMNRDELAQAIPPAYTQYIGQQLLTHIAGTHV